MTLFLATALGIPGVHNSHHPGSIIGVGSVQKLSCGGAGAWPQHRLGMDLHHPGLRVHTPASPGCWDRIFLDVLRDRAI